MSYTVADFKRAQFAYHEGGMVAMRSSRFPVDRREDSRGIHHSDVGMIHAGFIPLPNLADALIAQQQTMQASLDEVVRELSERRWDEGHEAGYDDAKQGAHELAINPYRSAES